SRGILVMSASDLLKVVQTQQSRIADPRLREVLQSLVRHVHSFAADVHLTRDEWLAALAFLNRVGQTTTADRDEFMLLSDVLGLSSLMDVLHQPPKATEGTVLGPFYIPNAPRRAYGASLIDTDDGGPRLVVNGVVRSVEGTPLTNAIVEVWSCASNGLYP